MKPSLRFTEVPRSPQALISSIAHGVVELVISVLTGLDDVELDFLQRCWADFATNYMKSTVYVRKY